jgi:hypothetical protein
METHTLKTVFATLNPSPLFEALAIFGEELAISAKRPDRKKSALIQRTDYVPSTDTNSRSA